MTLSASLTQHETDAAISLTVAQSSSWIALPGLCFGVQF
jgi:hypothetical protein